MEGIVTTIIISVIGSFIVGAFSAYVMIRVSLAKFQVQMENSQANQSKDQELNNKILDEMRSDYKQIMQTLTKIQVEQAQKKGEDNAISVMKDAVEAIKKIADQNDN